MRSSSLQPISNLTFANIFVNSNYKFYVDNFIPEYKNWTIHLVANRKANTSNLPFPVFCHYPIDNTAFMNNYYLIREIKEMITTYKWKNQLFLFDCGPFGNMLARQLWQHNKENTYIDIGSTLNPWLESEGFKRDYYVSRNNGFGATSCVWG